MRPDQSGTAPAQDEDLAGDRDRRLRELDVGRSTATDSGYLNGHAVSSASESCINRDHSGPVGIHGRVGTPDSVRGSKYLDVKAGTVGGQELCVPPEKGDVQNSRDRRIEPAPLVDLRGCPRRNQRAREKASST
jgi:hypothetical protein